MNFNVWIVLVFLTCVTFVIGYFNYVNAAFVSYDKRTVNHRLFYGT